MPSHNVLIHIGYHKTATSALQSQLFARPEGPFLLPPDEPRHALVEYFVVPQPLAFDPEATRQHYMPFLKLAQKEGKCAIFSHERFSGYPATGGFDSTIIARRLQRTLPEAKVLVVFREQLASILSFYSQYVSDGGDMSLKSYLHQYEPGLKRVPSFSPEFYRYDRLFRLYQDLFGVDRVRGLVYEQFRQDPDAFVARVCDLVDVGRDQVSFSLLNQKRSALVQVGQRFMNRAFSDNQLSHSAILPIERFSKRFAKVSRALGTVVPTGIDRAIEARWRKRIETAFDGRYADSNRNLSELISIDLAQFGYQLPEVRDDT